MITYKNLGQKGRLGNQLFQIATTISCALENNDQYAFPNWNYEKFFNLHNCFSNNISYQNNYEEPFFHYQKITYKKDLNINGFFQSYKYFDNNKDLIKKIFTSTYNLPETNITSIHVRRGDYLQFSNYHTVLGMDYYNKAMEICPSTEYYIFSDDITWCKNNFKGNQFTFISGNNEVLDLSMMSKCENQIIANSSFSWWGAYLNNNLNKKVIAPSKWFGPASTHNIKDLFPTDWINI